VDLALRSGIICHDGTIFIFSSLRRSRNNDL
jgi:hypothetical protein